MQIKINDPKNILNYSFFEWLIVKIRDKFLNDIDVRKLLRIEIFLKSLYKDIDVEKVILQAFDNLIITESINCYYIKINPNIFIANLDRVNLLSICKFINYGNAEIPGYQIFTNTFDHFAKNIDTYINRYLYMI